MMSDTIATRLLESSEKAPAGAGRALRMSELYERLTQAVWSELDGRGDIAPLRREVQRDHVNRIAAVLIRPGAASRADTRGVVRVQAGRCSSGCARPASATARATRRGRTCSTAPTPSSRRSRRGCSAPAPEASRPRVARVPRDAGAGRPTPRRQRVMAGPIVARPLPSRRSSHRSRRRQSIGREPALSFRR